MSKKGSPIHKSAGKIYLLAMTGIITSALPLAVSMRLNKKPVGGTFLPMLSGPVLQNMAWLGPLPLSIFAGIYLKREYIPKRA